MRVFISSDIEGTTGITHWEETEYENPLGARWYDYFREQMSREVAAACEGALAAGATDILVKDAHASGRNIIPERLPESVRINRGWSGDLLSMVDGLRDGFDALAFTGYHAPGYSDGNPLSHTITTSVDEITINGERVSEFKMHSYAAGALGIPVVFLCGDAALCKEAAAFIPGITTVAVNEGKGNSTTSIHPCRAVALIKAGMQQALSGHVAACSVPMPRSFDVQVRYVKHPRALFTSQYPGARRLDEKTVAFASDDYFEVMRFFRFVL